MTGRRWYSPINGPRSSSSVYFVFMMEKFAKSPKRGFPWTSTIYIWEVLLLIQR